MKKRREKERLLSTSSTAEVCYDDLTLCQRSSGSQQALNNDGNSLVDRISDLPDELLQHILCFLPTKLSFTTTVLSKRWSKLCCSLPVLCFEDETTKDYDAFLRFCRIVDTILLSPRATNQPLKMFRLKCRFKDHNQKGPFNVTEWLEASKQRSIEEVHLTLYYHTLKPSIFIFQTLVVLKLERLNVGADTSCVDLPSLKTLTLEYVYFENWNDYINFLYACPILEDLHAQYINTFSYNVPEEGFKSLALPKLVRASISEVDAQFNVDGDQLVQEMQMPNFCS
ncbi:putative FBD-associated F-box protein At5g53635 [Medicago truncatula]|uniref:putative FBD-associated F-box protein At5g53635 n=1 Tax=Medicago truncatula TaxID=3880 RepID=UPI000D2F363D|nr:putative FBD-associated F-box protein At5g53635 [Medicago truncatula]